MNRTTAIILTIVTALFCGLPGVGLMCFAALGLAGSNTPGFYQQNPGSTPQQTWLGAGAFVCVGILLLIIPLLVGIFSFKMSKPVEAAFNESPLPPAS